MDWKDSAAQITAECSDDEVNNIGLYGDFSLLNRNSYTKNWYRLL